MGINSGFKGLRVANFTKGFQYQTELKASQVEQDGRSA